PAPVSGQSVPSFSIWRAASATRMPSRENSRASDALRPSPAPTIRAILYFGVSIRVSLYFGASISAAQSRKTARGFQHRIERGLIGHISIFRAQHGERSRVIFLRL